MNLSFKNNFVPLILSGEKIHTIRNGKNADRWEAGRNIHFCTGLRTSKYNCFKQAPCTAVQEIHMTYFRSRLEITVDDRYLYWPDISALIKNDGLTYDEFLEWFFKDTDEFSGVLVHWTDLKY